MFGSSEMDLKTKCKQGHILHACPIKVYSDCCWIKHISNTTPLGPSPFSKTPEQMSLNLQGLQSRWMQKEIQSPSKTPLRKLPSEMGHLTSSLSYRSPTLSLTHYLRLKTSKSLLNNEAQQLTLQKNSRKFFFSFPRLRPKQWLVNDKREGKIKEGYEEIRPSPAGSNTIA